MAFLTPHLGLSHHDLADNLTPTKFNDNLDILDAAMGNTYTWNIEITGLYFANNTAYMQVKKNGNVVSLEVASCLLSEAITDWKNFEGTMKVLSEQHKIFSPNQSIVLPVASNGGICGNLFIKCDADGHMANAWWRVDRVLAIGEEIIITASWIAG